MTMKKLFNPRLSEKEKKEFEALAKANLKKAYFTALGFLGSRDDAVEISQEAFLRAYVNFKKFDRSKNFFAWYYRILKNLCLNFIRDSRAKKTENFLEPEKLESEETDPALKTENNELHEQIENVMNKLNFKDREIIILKEFQNMSYKEISEILNIPLGTVMSRLFYARKKLAEKLKGVI